MTDPDIVSGPPRASEKLVALIEKFADGHFAASQVAEQVLLQARQEGLQIEYTRGLITSALKRRHLSDRAIRSYLPAELKNAAKAAARARPNKNRQSTEEIDATKEIVVTDTKAPPSTDEIAPVSPDIALAGSAPRLRIKQSLSKGLIYGKGSKQSRHYLPSRFKGEIQDKELQNALKQMSEGTYPDKLAADIVMQRDAIQLLHVLQAEFAGEPLSMHKIELHLRIPCEEYEQLSLRVDASNRQKRHHERIRHIAVDYAFSPTGSIEVHIACSNQPFRIATYHDLITLYSTLGQARDRLICLLSDTSESIVPPLPSWILKRCDINKDLPLGEHGINYLRVNMQLKHASEAFRVYTKSLGDKLVLRAEKEQTPETPLHVYISNILDGGTHTAEMQETILAAYARALSRKQCLDSALMTDST